MSRDSAKALMRTNSLALSDFSQGDMKDEDLTGDFVDPFADESDLLIDTTLQQKAPRLLRNISSGDRPTSIRRNSSLSSRYVSSELSSRQTAAEFPPTTNSKSNCFCDCGQLSSEIGSGKCICSELADHLLHRADGLELYVHDDRIV